MSRDFAFTLVGLVGLAIVVCLVVAGFVYGANSRGARRYRPGRPFEFRPVWFLAASRREPDDDSTGREPAVGRRQITSGNGTGGKQIAGGKQVVARTQKVSHRHETGGASDRW